MADETKTDSDADGLSDAVERQLGTNINQADSDGDGLIDGFEVAVGQPRVRDLSITDPAGSAAIVDDLVTGIEQIVGVTTHNVDSDGDGFADWVEEMRGGSDRNVADVTAAQILNNQDPLEEFMHRAQSQMGVPYRFGAEADLDDSSGAEAFDSSELVQWAAHQAGVELPDGSWKQYQALHSAGSAVSVDVALETKGALLFGFSSDPLASPDRPQRAYVAISLGNGKVLDVSERAGEVREMEPGNFFTHAATIPGFHPDATTDTDGDGHPDIDEDLMGGDPTQGITQPWRDTWNMDSDGDGLSDAEDPEPHVPATREPDPAAPVEPAEPSDSPAPSDSSTPTEPTEPDSELQYAASDPPAHVDFAAPYDPGADSSYGMAEPYGSEPTYDTADPYNAEMEG
jgi:cell wall-associated NlpC family hydrolase